MWNEQHAVDRSPCITRRPTGGDRWLGPQILKLIDEREAKANAPRTRRAETRSAVALGEASARGVSLEHNVVTRGAKLGSRVGQAHHCETNRPFF